MRTTTTTPRLSNILAVALVKAGLVAAAATVAAVSSGAAGTMYLDTSPHVSTPNPAQALIAAHHCHADLTDGDTSAVVTLPGETAPVWTGDLPTRQAHRVWTAVVFGHTTPGTTIHAVC